MVHPLALLVLVLHAPTALLAISVFCSEDYGRPTLADCRAAIDRLPFSSTPVMFGPPGSGPGAITCPFGIPSGTCTIRIQCRHLSEVNWGLMHTLATVLVEGDGGATPGCIKDLGKGGVAALGRAGDPLWIDVTQTGVQGPGSVGGNAPLLKGLSEDQLAEAGLEPPKPSGPVLRMGPSGRMVL